MLASAAEQKNISQVERRKRNVTMVALARIAKALKRNRPLVSCRGCPGQPLIKTLKEWTSGFDMLMMLEGAT
jgi:predicted component of type VI protein secretion system